MRVTLVGAPVKDRFILSYRRSPPLSLTLSRPTSMALAGPSRRQTARSVQSTASSDKQLPPPKAVRPASLARRLLFPQLPPDLDLPPLLVSPLATPELNDELYNFIAIALRAYIHPWWTKITRYDKEFLPAITRVLTNVMHVLEARLSKTDLSPLILRDIPILVSNHYTDYRNAQAKLQTSYASGGAATLSQLFHQIQPHMAVSADGTVDESYVRQALDKVLRTSLPPADYEPETERYIVREILVKVVQGGIVPRVTQPWFIHQIILNLLGPEKRKQSEVSYVYLSNPCSLYIEDESGGTQIRLRYTKRLWSSSNCDSDSFQSTDFADGLAAPQRPPLQRTSSYSFSFQSLVIVLLSTIRSVSGACLALIHAYRSARDTIKKANQSGALFPNPVVEVEKKKTMIPGSLLPLSPVPPPATYTPASPSPSPPPSPPHVYRTDPTVSPIPTVSIIPPPVPPAQPQPNYVQPILQLISTMITPPTTPTAPPRSVPLALTHLLTLLLTPFMPTLSRLFPHLLYTHAFSAESLLAILQSTRTAMFPGGWPAQSPPDPTPEEQLELRRELTRRLLTLVPAPCLPVLGPTPPARVQALDSILDPLSSQECNAHLIVFVLDLVLLTLFPEMGVAPPSAVPDAGLEGTRTPGSLDSVAGTLTPPRPDSRPP